MRTIYLAHPIETRFKLLKFNYKLESKYPIRLVSPFYETYRQEIHTLDTLTSVAKKNKYRKSWTVEQKQHIVLLDLKLIDECDSILAYVPYPTIGTSMEIQRAYDTKKTIYIISNNTTHPWLINHATQIFSTFSSFDTFLINQLDSVKCKKCGLIKKKSEFYQTQLSTAHFMCISCYQKYYDLHQGEKINSARENRDTNINRVRKNDRERSRETRKTQEHKCRMRTLAAIKSQQITRQPCEECGALIVEAHHSDYTKPFEIQWLCHTHHMELHKNKRRV
jgi:nucleoside 2-deoxyribosyltransferase